MALTPRRDVRNAPVVPIGSNIPELEDLARQFRGLQRSLPDFMAGKQITTQVSGAGTVKLTHGLGRNIRGWWVTRVQSGVPRTVTELDSDTTSISLAVSGSCTLGVWVY
jgi:hypothetical protein